jgi:hypothetical protein
LQEDIAPPATVRSEFGFLFGNFNPAGFLKTLQPGETDSQESLVTLLPYSSIEVLKLEVCAETAAYAGWLDSVDPEAVSVPAPPMPVPVSVPFSLVVGPPADAIPGTYSFKICAVADGTEFASQSVIIEVYKEEVPTAIDVAIDIKPGSDANSINLGSKGKGKAADSNAKIPVALFSTVDFDATLVDVSTVALGDLELDDTPVVLKKNGTYQASAEDVNDDGLMDMVFHFARATLLANGDLTEASVELSLTGVYVDEDGDEQDIIGEDAVRVIH